MTKMEKTKHGRGSALAMGLAGMHVCVLLGFDERLYAGIDGFNVCVRLEFDERLCAGIDYFICVFCWNLVIDYVLGLIIAFLCVFMLKSCDFAGT
jgi:hypothetical protein